MTKAQLRIGIAGVGVIGGALYRWLKKNTSHEVLREDPGLGFSELDPILMPLDVLFVCVPVPTVGTHLQQDLCGVREVIRKFGKGAKIFIRSTVLPQTCDQLSRMHDADVYSMPEFLTERSSDEDFAIQNIVAGAREDDRSRQYTLLKQIFPGSKDILLMTNVEAELAKYMHNGNGTIKVHFNNLIYQLAKKIGADYERVRFGALMSGYIGENHTQVPGPDGRLGYGGKCFPKDLDALIGLLDAYEIPCASLVATQLENREFRGDE